MTDESTPMEITPEELQQLNALRKGANDIVVEIGQIEIHKGRLLGRFIETEARANQLLSSVAKRLGIEDGKKFQVDPTGKVTFVEDPGPMGPGGPQVVPPGGNGQ